MIATETLEVKEYLHRWIVNTNDFDLLEQVKTFISKQLTAKTDWWDELTEAQKKAVEKGYNDIRSGKGIPHSQVRAKVRKLIDAAK